jgi:hypothetical protein
MVTLAGDFVANMTVAVFRLSAFLLWLATVIFTAVFGCALCGGRGKSSFLLLASNSNLKACRKPCRQLRSVRKR